VFAAYISFGACPRYLLSAAVMSAPGSLACAKLLYPETEESCCRTVDELDLPPRYIFMQNIIKIILKQIIFVELLFNY
jgi:nucleoside permease NupC